LITRWFKKVLPGRDRAKTDNANAAEQKQPASTSKQAVSSKQTSKHDLSKSNKTKNQARQSHKKEKKQAAPAWDISMFQVPEMENKTRFHDLDLPDPIMHAIQDLGYEYCSPIQAQTLPHTLSGHDAIGKAQTGTGKTAAFLLTIIDDILAHPQEGKRFLREPRALVIAPTRELVIQIAKDAQALCKYTDLSVATLIGGMPYDRQLKSMQGQPVDIVVATPGRLIDFMTRRDIRLNMIESLVLDEADRMLDMGFIPQVKRIVRATPNSDCRQTQLFSATFTQDVMNLAEQWTFEPIKVEIEPESVATDSVDQKVYMVSSDEKFSLLTNVLKQPDTNSVIVFVNRRDQTRKLYEKIKKTGFKVGILSGEVSQAKRTSTLESFRAGNIKVLVATDVAGRGIHIDGISHVVNYNLPEDPEDYVHRIGRTGRAGATGVSISFACEDEAFMLPDIEELLGSKLKCELPPEELLS